MFVGLSGGMVDTPDSKSGDSNIVRVQVSPWAPLLQISEPLMVRFLIYKQIDIHF